MNRARRSRLQASRLRTQLRAASSGRAPLRVGPGSSINAPSGATMKGESISFDQAMARRDQNAVLRSGEIAQLRTQRTAQRVMAAGKQPDYAGIFAQEQAKIAQGGSRGFVVPGSSKKKEQRQRESIAKAVPEIAGGITPEGLKNVANLPTELQDQTAPGWKERFTQWVNQQNIKADELIKRQQQALGGQGFEIPGLTNPETGQGTTIGQVISEGITQGEGPVKINPILKLRSENTALTSFQKKIFAESEKWLKDLPGLQAEEKAAMQRVIVQKADESVAKLKPVAENSVKQWKNSKEFWKEYATQERKALGTPTTLGKVAKLTRAEAAQIGGTTIPQQIINTKKEGLIKKFIEKLFTTTQNIETTNLRTGFVSQVQQKKVSPIKAAAIGAAAVSGIVLNIWSEWYRRDNGIGALQITMRDAIKNEQNGGDPAITDEIVNALDKALHPSIITNIARWTPFLGAGVNAIQSAEMQMKALAVEKMILQEERIRNELVRQGILPENNFAIQAAVNRELEQQMYDDNREMWAQTKREIIQYESAARAENREEEAAFWLDYKEKIHKMELEQAEKIAEFWFAYRKRVLKLQEQHGPSQLAFGGGFR